MKEWIKQLAVYEPGKPIEEVARELGFDEVADIIKVASMKMSLGHRHKRLKRCRKRSMRCIAILMAGRFILRKLARTLRGRTDTTYFR